MYSILKHRFKIEPSLSDQSSADLPEQEVEKPLDDLCAQDEEPRVAQDDEPRVAQDDEPRVAQDDEPRVAQDDEPRVAQDEALANSQKEEYEKTKEENDRLKDALAALEKELQQAKEGIDRENILVGVWSRMYSSSQKECLQKDETISKLKKELEAEKRNEYALKQRLREYLEMDLPAPVEVPVYSEGYWVKKYNRAESDMYKAVKRAESYKKRVAMLESKLCQIDGLTGVPDQRKEKLPCFYFAGKCFIGNLRDLEKRLNEALDEEGTKWKQKVESLSEREKALSSIEGQLEERKRLFARLYPDYVWVTKYKDEIQRQKKILEGDLKDLAPGFTLEKYEELLLKKEKYEKEKSGVYRKLDQLKKDKRIFDKERLQFDKKVAAFKQSKITQEGEITQLLEEYGQLLFVLRSFYKNHGLYEILLDDYLSKIDSVVDQRITRAYFLGESVYEIAREESKSAGYIRQVLARVVDVIGG
ncbi:MAG: hypothetical protein PHC95_01545 [Parabacteroides sp.]|nr:hypothetical protein [Parabacteroides sp.]